MEKKKNDGKLLEHIVAEMSSSIENAEVTHNAKILGKLTRKRRQIDVLIKGKYGFLDIIVEIEAKDYTRPVSITQVESFISKIEDTGADLGVMVCSKGFTEGAKARAHAANIQLFQVFSEKLKNTPFFIPVRMIIPEIKKYAVGFAHKGNGPFSMPSDLTRIRVKMEGVDLDLKQLLFYAWNQRKIPLTKGVHRVDFGAIILQDTQNTNYRDYCEVYFNVTIDEKYYLKIFPANFLENIRGSNKNFFLSLPIFSDTEKLNEVWQQFRTLEEMNTAAAINEQSEDVKNLIVKPWYTLEMDHAKFDPNE